MTCQWVFRRGDRCDGGKHHVIHRHDAYCRERWGSNWHAPDDACHPYEEEPMPDPTPTVLNVSPDALQGVLSAAIAWSDSYERINGDMASGGYPGGVILSPEGRKLYDAVQRAKGVRPGGTFADTDRYPDKEEARRVMQATLDRVKADAPSEDPQLDTARRVAEAIGGDREVTVIIVGDI